jgi:hypothetical protein
MAALKAEPCLRFLKKNEKAAQQRDLEERFQAFEKSF